MQPPAWLVPYIAYTGSVCMLLALLCLARNSGAETSEFAQTAGCLNGLWKKKSR